MSHPSRADGDRAAALVKRYWLPVVLVVLGVVFVLQNRDRTTISFLWWNLSAPLWLTLTTVIVLAVLAGWMLGRGFHKR